MRRLALLLLVLCAPLAAAEAATLQPFKATYTIRWGGLTAGTGELELERMPDGRWAYSSRLRGRGLGRLALPASQVSRSIFRIVDDRLVPESFVSEEHDQQLTFDWAGQRVTGSVKGRPVDLPAQPGLLDTLSAQVAMMQELIAGRTPSRFVVVDEDRIKDYLYAVEGSEVLESAAGTHRTDIYSSRRPGSRKGTFFWSAPELGHLPLKVERRDGRSVEWSMQLTSLVR